MNRTGLSVDGGGDRAVFSLEVMEQITETTGMPLHQSFDEAAGVSAGALAIIGLGVPSETGTPLHTPGQLKNIVTQYDGEIFGAKNPVRFVYRPEYARRGLVDVINRTCPQAAMDSLLFKKVTIPAGCIAPKEIQNVYFTKSGIKLGNQMGTVDKVESVLNVLCSTTAAPTYFAPNPLECGPHQLTLVDGGVGGNNPAVLLDECTVVCSIGTGSHYSEYPYAESKEYGDAEWLTKIIPMMFNQSTERTNDLAREHLGDKFFRWDASLEENIPMDTTKEKNIELLESYAKQIIDHRREEFEIMCNYLKRGADVE